MNGKMAWIAAMLLILIGASGCATAMTMMSPVTSEVVVSEKRTGAFERYEYEYVLGSGHITLTKTPLCSEVAKPDRIERKRTIGYGPAMLEMAFFGLGLLDIASAKAISEASRKITPMDEYATGQLLACGKPEPATGEVLVIESQGLNAPRSAITDASGRIDLERVIGRTPRAIPLTVRMAADKSVSFTCLYKSTGDSRPRGSDLAMR